MIKKAEGGRRKSEGKDKRKKTTAFVSSPIASQLRRAKGDSIYKAEVGMRKVENRS